jgi:hypothetical protein
MFAKYGTIRYNVSAWKMYEPVDQAGPPVAFNIVAQLLDGNVVVFNYPTREARDWNLSQIDQMISSPHALLDISLRK